MDLVEIKRHLDNERRRLARDGEVHDILPDVTRVRIGDQHTVVWSLLTEATADDAIVREIDYHRRAGVGFEWKLYSHDAPADLLHRLQRFGLTAGPREAVLAYDLADATFKGDDTPDCTVVRITRPEQVEDYRRVVDEVSGRDNGFIIDQLAAAVAAGSTEHTGYVAYAGGEPVSTGRLYTHPRSRFGGLYGGSTRRDHRGRGYYRAVVAARARDAADLGARYLIVDALPTSRPILERLGFRWVTDTWPCEWQPPASTPPQ